MRLTGYSAACATMLFLLSLPTKASAASVNLAANATVTRITVGALNTDSVQVYFSGGSGACASGGFVLFYQGNFTGSSRMQFILQTAFAAYLSGKQIDIYDEKHTAFTDCNSATLISIH